MLLLTQLVGFGGYATEAPPPGEGFSCNVTLGTYLGSTAYIAGFLGSIDQEPISGETLEAVLSVVTPEPPSTMAVSFAGNIMGIVEDLDVWFDGQQYLGTWAFDGSSTQFTASDPDSVSNFPLAATTYLMEIK